jgi:hercynylcysteine S-oxide lyase
MRNAPDTKEKPVPFGQQMRTKHFNFDSAYTPLNHGSFGTYPELVNRHQRRLQVEAQARPDTFRRLQYPRLLQESREALAPLLGADTDEVVLVPNAATAFNTVLRNLTYKQGDVILYFSTIYSSFLKTIQSLEETTPVRGHAIPLTYPIEDDQIVQLFKSTVEYLRGEEQGKTIRLASFDTVLTFPGVSFPWEEILANCQDLGILSCVDGAHGLGHIPLQHLSHLAPDFFISNCYKWLMVPTGCSVLYVPYRNQSLIRTTFPTSEDYKRQGPMEEEEDEENRYFIDLFTRVGTIDPTPYLCIPAALEFRERGCGGEPKIREYCYGLARQGGDIMAEILGTEVMDNKGKTLRVHCCFTNIRLPLDVVDDEEQKRGTDIANWISLQSMTVYNSYLPTRYYNGKFWCRLSSQIYLEVDDFIWAAKTLLELCERAKQGDWDHTK